MFPTWPTHYREETAAREQQPQEDSSCHAVSSRLVKIESKKRRVGEGNTACTQRRLVLTPTMSVHKPELRCQHESEKMSVKQLMKNHLAIQVSKSKSVTRWERHAETDEDCASQSNSNSAMVGANTVHMQHEDITLKSDDGKDSVPKFESSTTVTAEFVDDDLRRSSIVFDLVWRECNGNDMYMRGKALAMALSQHSDGKEADAIVMGYPGGTTSRDPTITCLEVDKIGSLVAAGSVDGRVAVYVDVPPPDLYMHTQKTNLRVIITTHSLIHVFHRQV